MTAEPVRNLGYIAWKDPWAWMEKMSGARWKELLADEEKNWNTIVGQPTVRKNIPEFKEQIAKATEFIDAEVYSIGCNSIFISYSKKDSFWRWKWSKRRERFYDIDFQGNIVWYVRPDTIKSSSLNELVCRTSYDKILWKKKFTSSDIAVVDNFCYYIKVEGLIQTVELACCNAVTGEDEVILYREKDPKCYLSIVKTGGRSLYLQSSNAGFTRTWRIERKKLTELDNDTVYQMPVGQIMNGEDCRVVKRAAHEPDVRMTPHYELRGWPLKDWNLPKGGFPIWISLEGGFAIMMRNGQESLWKCGPKKNPRLLFSISAGEILPNPYANWESALVHTFHIMTPEQDPFVLSAVHDDIFRIPLKKTGFPKLQIHNSSTKSADGKEVPFAWIMKASRKAPKALLVTAYGSYGQTTVVRWPWQYWGPLLEKGWAVAYAYVRGGGEKDFDWAEAGRREHRHGSVEDMLAVIKACRMRLGVPAERTAIYGRSAGGFLIGSALAREPDGALFGAVFSEVPYVDVLRTSSNPKLPLTIGEWDEFGNPQQRIQDFAELLSVSPINSLPLEGAGRKVLVITRTGLLDYKVYPYEPYKWIQRLRGYLTPSQANPRDPKGKYIDYEPNEGHSYGEKHFAEARAEDLAILEAWQAGELRF
jgi:hypothetical protein